MSYRPLPSFLTVKPSKIDGLGLFCTEALPKGKVLGVTHVEDERFPNGYIRTPMGGFFNHSETPNCETLLVEDYIVLSTLTEIKKGEEITVKYWMYNIGEDNEL